MDDDCKPPPVSRALMALPPAAILAFCVLTSAQSTLSAPNVALFTSAFVLAGLACVAAAWLEARRPGLYPLWLMMAAALVFRAVMIPFGPLLDNDVYRYLWDGHVGASGTNPYLYPPESMPFEGTDFPYFARINYPWVSTIYPPLAQVMFVIAVRLHLTTPIAFKLLLLPFDLGTIVLLIRMLRRLERPVGLVVIYAWSPLALKEVFNSAHVDVVMIFLMLLAVHLAILRQPAAAGLSIGLSVMTKGASAVIAPILAKRRPYRVIATAVVAIGALWLPYASAGTKIFGGASAYAHYWRFNDGAFYILCRAGQALTGGDDPSATVAKVAAATIFVAYLAICTRRRATAASGIITSCRNVLMALLLLMPVVNPWYVCWLVPFLCLMPSRGMLALSILCPLSYLYYRDNSFPQWIRLAEYAPVYGLLVWDTVKARKPKRC